MKIRPTPLDKSKFSKSHLMQPQVKMSYQDLGSFLEDIAESGLGDRGCETLTIRSKGMLKKSQPPVVESHTPKAVKIYNPRSRHLMN